MVGEVLAYDETMNFSLAERDVMLGDVLEWLRVAVLPSLALLEQVGEERGFDVYDLLKKRRNQLNSAKNKSDSTSIVRACQMRS